MNNTSEAPVWIVILRNVLISATAGTLFGCLLFPLFGAILQATQRDNYAPFNLEFLLTNTLTSPLLILYIRPLLLSLIGMACLAGIIFQKSIQKHLKFWCIISPFVVWFTAIAILASASLNQHGEQLNWFERFVFYIPNPNFFLFLIAPTFSAFIFYKLSKKGLKW